MNTNKTAPVTRGCFIINTYLFTIICNVSWPIALLTPLITRFSKFVYTCFGFSLDL
jgi:hypothetical protein